MPALGRALLQAAVVVSFLLFAAPAQAATVITWSGPDNFDAAEIAVPDFYADVLTLISGPGFYHDLGNNRIFSGSLRINGVWIEVGNSGPTFGFSGDVPLSLIGPLSFPGGVITALRLTVSGPVGFGFNAMTGTAFNFDVAQTPLPGALVLFASVLGLAALGRKLKRI